MKLKILVLFLFLLLLAMFVHGYFYITSFDINTEYGRDDTRMLGTIAFILYRFPFYLIGLIIILLYLFFQSLREKKYNK